MLTIYSKQQRYNNNDINIDKLSIYVLKKYFRTKKFFCIFFFYLLVNKNKNFQFYLNLIYLFLY